MEPRHLEELRTRGYTVIRGLVGADQCAAARAAIDAALGGPGPTDAVDTQLAAGLGENSGSANHIHAIAHPHPAMAVMAPSMPAVAEVHAAALRSDRQHLCLNGQSLLRSDPTDDPTAHERGVVGSGWHLGKCSRSLCVFLRSLKEAAAQTMPSSLPTASRPHGRSTRAQW